MGDKKGTTLRLCSEARQTLAIAKSVLGKPYSRITEEALRDYANKHNLGDSGYQVTLTDDNIILHRTVNGMSKIVEVTQRNGVPDREVVDKYRAKLGSSVILVEQGEQSWKE